MPHFVVDKVQNALNDHSKPLRGSHIHVMGMAYKRDIDDVRESPALDIVHLLAQRGAKMTYSDPHVPKVNIDGLDMQAQDPVAMAAAADCVVIATDHTSVDYAVILEKATLIVDTRNALKGIRSDKIVRL
jgi:UDP-N-acetyl-D-glucosamine dehydrogenase